MTTIVYEHPTKRTITKTYNKQDFATVGDIRTNLRLTKDEGYTVTMRITVPNAMMEVIKNYKK